MGSKNGTLEERFWTKVDKNGPNGCWLWVANKVRGYGRVWCSERNMLLSHRVSWELHNGTIPEGMEVCHSCDNPPCCNPDHLFLGTHKSNMLDMVSKKRQDTARGEKNGQAKLNQEKVLKIRELCQAGLMSVRAIARQFDVDPALVRRIFQRKAWKHVVG